MAFAKQLSEQPLKFAPPRADGEVKGDVKGDILGAAKPDAKLRKTPAKPLPFRLRKLHKARAKDAAADDARVRKIGLGGGALTPTIPLHHALAMEPEALLDATWPTYRVRVFFDSRHTFTAQQAKDPVLVPMPSFGLRLNHEGSLYGFTHALEAANGVVLEPVANAPNWFKVKVPSEGSFKVKTTVAALEEPKPGGGGEECEPPGPPQPCPTCQEVEHGRCHCRVVGMPKTGGAALLGLAFLTFAVSLRRRGARSRASQSRC
jgi:hypothetical protein